jgi:hypothetical protein
MSIDPFDHEKYQEIAETVNGASGCRLLHAVKCEWCGRSRFYLPQDYAVWVRNPNRGVYCREPARCKARAQYRRRKKEKGVAND